MLRRKQSFFGSAPSFKQKELYWHGGRPRASRSIFAREFGIMAGNRMILAVFWLCRGAFLCAVITPPEAFTSRGVYEEMVKI